MNEHFFDDYELVIRTLTPHECLRFMDVDEKHIQTLTSKDKGKQIISDSKLYQLAGNSIVVSCLEGIFENLFFPKQETGDQLKLF